MYVVEFSRYDVKTGKWRTLSTQEAQQFDEERRRAGARLKAPLGKESLELKKGSTSGQAFHASKRASFLRRTARLDVIFSFSHTLLEV